ncbi:MAG: response regulator [Nitrospirae bacterium]|nr:response regulator [Nitrospirota bacterium]
MGIRAILQRLGFHVAARVKNGQEAVRKVRELRPDLAILDIKMPGMDGLEAARQILAERPIPIIILTAFSERQLVAEADQIGVASYLVKPVAEEDLLPAITLAVSRFQQLQDLRAEVGDLKEALMARKVIEKAKGVLMQRQGLTEEEAYRRLQKQSRDRNVPMVQLAEAILTAEEIL